MSQHDKYLIKAGETAHGPYQTDITTQRAGWEYSSIRVLALAPGQEVSVPGTDAEFLVLPLEGSCEVVLGAESYALEGRESVWTDITDYLYIPRNTDIVVRSKEGGRFALPGAIASADLPVTYCDRSKVITSLRGAGPSSRQVNNYALGNDVKTSHLLACEVLTPGGNWSSYPPHKHDEHTDVERKLEEIYFYQVRPGAQDSEGFAFQRIYTSNVAEIDFCAEVRDGDVVVMPFGYHGPSAAAPGYDLYYLNVMAGPAEDAAWLMTDDPKHAWIRDSWKDQEVDPRLPMTPMNP
ncbi:5-deoxy-glucuronate isomerase [Actinomycetaceae bacterium WB03_NA08]|uniref:5-deoxy-glucuronate isomerase n=1 Tax=Scrofimicrobium canadense TaxID=2652290 RepID=A0A6N7W5M2_9ACTO|nr:5-deoxy-glucuronate isomerase [Scrofimicrobium canadense]MSS84615.1 5-deoxy-glucuronate isomerase [Scrofimicrobium canadense]